MSIVIGIDPGLDGAVCIRHVGGILFFDTPTLLTGKGGQRCYDLAAMRDILVEWTSGIAFIERQQSMPGQGVASTFSTGKGYGIWLGLLAGLCISHEIIAPVSWKKALMADMPKEKDASRIKALQLFPNLADQLKRKKDHGRSDALLIAEYGMRRQRVA